MATDLQAITFCAAVHLYDCQDSEKSGKHYRLRVTQKQLMKELDI